MMLMGIVGVVQNPKGFKLNKLIYVNDYVLIKKNNCFIINGIRLKRCEIKAKCRHTILFTFIRRSREKALFACVHRLFSVDVQNEQISFTFPINICTTDRIHCIRISVSHATAMNENEMK